MACLCKFDESGGGNLVQKYGVLLVMIEKNFRELKLENAKNLRLFL